MEWVEVTGKTVAEAKEAALDQLGVDEAEAEFEVLEEPRPGLFGRLRSEARVRARVMPSAPRPKVDRRDRRRGPTRGGSRRGGRGGNGGEGASGAAAAGTAGGGDVGAAAGPGGRGRGQNRTSDREDAVDEGALDEDFEDGDEVEVALEFLQGLLETFGAPFTVQERELEEDFVELSVQGDGLGLLIGPRGQTLAAVQELTRTVVQRRSRGRSGRIVVDISGYRRARRAALERFANDVAGQVRASGVAKVLEPMPPADRKVVHDAINVLDGVTTSSEGEEPRRRVVILPEKPAE